MNRITNNNMEDTNKNSQAFVGSVIIVIILIVAGYYSYTLIRQQRIEEAKLQNDQQQMYLNSQSAQSDDTSTKSIELDLNATNIDGADTN